jgi:hypothetical protein
MARRLYQVRGRHARTWGWLTLAAVVVLIAVGIAYSTGFWGEAATGTGSHAPPNRVAPGAGAAGSGVPNAGPR